MSFLFYYALHLAKFMRFKPFVARKFNPINPKFGDIIIPNNMNMWAFTLI